MPEYLPLNEKQLNSLPQHTDPLNPKVRFVAEDGASICIVSGQARGDGWIYHDRPQEFIVQVVRYLDENNPGHKFRAVVVSDEEVARIEEELHNLRNLEVPYS